MDTRFWGPSAWCLFHLIAAEERHMDPTAVGRWFELMEFVLPCKFCRASFHQYVRLEPLPPNAIRDRDRMSRWMYNIHNRVNGKLRGQGLLTKANPTWSSVRTKYYEMQRTLCDTPLIGWDFFSSVAYSTPGKSYRVVPMPNSEEVPVGADLATRNRYNLLSRAERIQALNAWWSLIPSILPCDAWRSAWNTAVKNEGAPPLRKGREAMMRWIWRVEASVCGSLNCATPHSSCKALQKEVGAFESDCGKKTDPKSVTCRTRKNRERKQVMFARRTQKKNQNQNQNHMSERALRIAQRTLTPGPAHPPSVQKQSQGIVAS
jgi:hypothetical protein